VLRWVVGVGSLYWGLVARALPEGALEAILPGCAQLFRVGHPTVGALLEHFSRAEGAVRLVPREGRGIRPEPCRKIPHT
jgi:hypothetical protein